MNNLGVSGVITVVILIVITLSLLGIVYTIVLPIVTDNLDRADACSPKILDKIKLNREHTCYDKDNEQIETFIEIKDVELDKIIVMVSNEDGTEISEIKKEGDDLKQNTGKTYPISSLKKPTSIKLIPVINDEQCQIVDSINDIKDCP